MDVDEALNRASVDRALKLQAGSVLAHEVERLREVVAGDGARIFALQARVIALEEIEARAQQLVDGQPDPMQRHAARWILDDA